MPRPAEQEIQFDGDTLADRYRLGPRLGRGGQGTTWLALDEETGEHVAVKSFDLSRIEDWKELELFERECRVLKELSYPGIPRYVDQIRDEEHGRFHLVMEYVEGRSLLEVMREDGPLGEDALWDVLFETLDILSYLHRRSPPIVHRDIKPANLLRGSDGSLTLVDFGGVRDALREEGGSTVVGTFGYMAPEQLHGQAIPATDLYALGATLLHLGTGIEPEKLPRKGLRFDFADKLRVSKDLAAILRRLTEPEPEKRPESAVTLLAELESTEGLTELEPEDAEAASPPEDEPPVRVPPAPPAVPTDLPWPLAFALGMLLTAVGLAGRAALAVAEYILIPLVFVVLQALSNKPQVMREREEDARRAARRARLALKGMADRGRRELRESRRWARSEERRSRRRDPESAARIAALRQHQERVRAQHRHRDRLHRRIRPTPRQARRIERARQRGR